MNQNHTVLAAAHKISPKGGFVMSDGKRFVKEELGEVLVDKMRFKIINRRPVNTDGTARKTKEDIRRVLWDIFKKYAG